MRRASTCLAILGLAVLSLPAAAAAEEIPTPTVKFKARAVPIPKPNGKGSYPGTGNFYGKGAAVEATYEFIGAGYGVTTQNPKGGVPPLSGVNFYLPKGVKLHPSGFGTCTAAKLKESGAEGCKPSSVASPLG